MPRGFWSLIMLLTDHEVSLPPAGTFLIGGYDAQLIAWVLPFGARIMQIFVRLSVNEWRPVTLGFCHPGQYRYDAASIGAVCGRYANRVGGAELSIAGNAIKLNANHEMGHCLHGGAAGFGVTDWSVQEHHPHEIQLVRHSPPGEMGFPGECEARCRYRIVRDELSIELDASVTEASPLNLVQHAYFCLDGTDLSEHRLRVPASQRLLTGKDELPTGLESVVGSEEDFRTGRKLCNGEQYQAVDRAFLLSEERRDAPTLAASLSASDLRLDVYTTERLLHVYTAGNLTETGAPLGPLHQPLRSVCLESEDWPNGPNMGKDVWYGPGKDYRQLTRWHFSH